MRVLILGGTGMLGHKLWQVCAQRFETCVTCRRAPDGVARAGFADSARILAGVSVEEFESVARALRAARPAVVVNCIGIVKQAAAARDPARSLMVNAFFPRRLAQLCRARGARLIHISTDCVFSGQKGGYREGDLPDARDLYGRTKLLGEVSGAGCLTLRTSMIGRELEQSYGLLEWFLSQGGKRIHGYTRAIFSGLTTNCLSELIAELIAEYPQLEGVRHLAGDSISKFDLLDLIRRFYDVDVEITPDERVVCDRSLNAEWIRRETGLSAPTWPDMVARMSEDITPYTEYRRSYAYR
jgi:dTDP-4-dehydrorhamnose reductase